jgi:hypothetical protein
MSTIRTNETFDATKPQVKYEHSQYVVVSLGRVVMCSSCFFSAVTYAAILADIQSSDKELN